MVKVKNFFEFSHTDIYIHILTLTAYSVGSGTLDTLVPVYKSSWLPESRRVSAGRWVAAAGALGDLFLCFSLFSVQYMSISPPSLAPTAAKLSILILLLLASSLVEGLESIMHYL